MLFADHLIAILAATIAAIYPYFIFYAAVGLTEPLFIALLLAAFLSWYRGAFFSAAIFAVLGILTRPAIELLAPLLVAYFACAVHGLGVKGAARQLAVYGAVYVALMSPWWLHNDTAYGSFVRLNLGSGFLFYAGNNPLSHTGGGLVDIDWNNHAFDTISDPIARDRAYRDAALTYIKEHPALLNWPGSNYPLLAVGAYAQNTEQHLCHRLAPQLRSHSAVLAGLFGILGLAGLRKIAPS